MKQVIFILIVFLWSCTKDSKQHNKCNNKILINTSSKTINFNTIFEGYDIIQIKGKVLGRIKKLYEKNNKLYFYTNSGNKRVHLFDLKSKKLKSFTEKGRGPHQINSIRDFYYYNDNLYVLDFLKKELHEYSEEGRLNKIIKLPCFCDNVYHLNPSCLILHKKMTYYDKKEFKLNLFSIKNNKFEKHYMPLNGIEEERDFAQLTTLYSVNDTVCFTQAFSDTIYNIFQEKIEPRYILDFGGKQLPYKMYNDINIDLRQFGLNCKKSNLIWDINCVLESNKNLFFVFRYGSKIFANIYYKNKKKCLTFCSFNDNVFSSLSNLELSEEFFPIYLTDNSLYFIVEPYYLIQAMENMRINNYKEWLELKSIKHPFFKLVNTMKLEDNPIVLKYNFAKS